MALNMVSTVEAADMRRPDETYFAGACRVEDDGKTSNGRSTGRGGCIVAYKMIWRMSLVSLACTSSSAMSVYEM